MADLIVKLSAKSTEWRMLSLKEKLVLLDRCLTNLDGDCEALSIEKSRPGIIKTHKFSDGPRAKSETALVSLTMVGHITERIKYYRDALKAATEGKLNYRELPTRQDKFSNAIIKKVFPITEAHKGHRLSAFTGEVWLDPAKPPKSTETEVPGVCVVLGAGNFDPLSLLDCLEALFVHNEVVLLKQHVLREYVLPVHERVMKHLIELGYFAQIADGGVEATKELIYHPLTRRIQLTGGIGTHDAIIRGAPGGVLKPLFTCELGCVTPWLIVPDGATSSMAPALWTDKNLKMHAKQVAACLKFFGSALCLAPKMLVLAKDWEHKEKFLNYIRLGLKEIQFSAPYYPGWENRFEKFVTAYGEDAEVIEVDISDNKGKTKVALLHVKLEEGNKGGNRFALTEEAFAPVLAIVEIDVSQISSKSNKDTLADKFLSLAPSFCNTEGYGSLSCSVMVPPTVSEESLERAISDLQYGQVAVNVWSAVTNGVPNLTWGAYGGLYCPENAGSGIGVLNNTYMFPDQQILKSVGRAPFINSEMFVGILPPSLLFEVLAVVSRKITTFGKILGALGVICRYFKLMW
eukprot:CAMPEP_0182427646 /NCGR_PEP_ID=MMETSP1167-20130531/18940_1 /TAXON_ID=2988 /ORGANISM="Mallomonas Sp, Strain CCMP3275" /LENGTH=574 /DNA_ID=CAMNT_0024610029 /DNA_START=55 /DNA_END=1776 /DNA_ORIENTATION=-